MKAVKTQVLILLSVLASQFLVGKKASFPVGLLMGWNAYTIAGVVLLSDLFLMFVVEWLFRTSTDKLAGRTYIRDRIERIQTRLENSNWDRGLIAAGWVGTMIITALPFMGGVWTGVAMARITMLSRSQTLIAVGVGAAIGCAIFMGAALGVMHLVTLEPA